MRKPGAPAFGSHSATANWSAAVRNSCRYWQLGNLMHPAGPSVRSAGHEAGCWLGTGVADAGRLEKVTLTHKEIFERYM
jgi:hypothetical protein